VCRKKAHMENTELKFKEVTYAIIGCAMEVHKVLGSGFMEFIYQQALEIEFKNAGIQYDREYEMKIIYKSEYIGLRRVDFLVNKIIPVELKAVSTLEDVHLTQALNYLEASNLETGLLINFGSRSLQYKRLLNRKYRQK
jgi:GxxExxY protein